MGLLLDYIPPRANGAPAGSVYKKKKSLIERNASRKNSFTEKIWVQSHDAGGRVYGGSAVA